MWEADERLKKMATAAALTDVQVQEMKELYAAGFNQRRLAEHFGVKECSIHYWLRKSGVTTHYNLRLTEEQVQEALRDYTAGVSTLVIGKRFGCSPQTIANMLQKQGVELREAGGRRRFSIREDAFDVRSEEGDYWLGMLATDGDVSGTKGVVDQVRLALKDEDSQHVVALQRFLGSEHDVALSGCRHPLDKSRELVRAVFRVRSHRLVEAVARYGIVPRKTFCLVAQGGVETSTHYWRGCVDGDGHVGIHASNQGPMACVKLTSASEKFIVQFRAFLYANGVHGSHAVIVEAPGGNSLAKHNKYTLYLGSTAAIDTAALLYVDAPVALPRKRRAAAEMILAGSRGALVGTVREAWSNSRALVWAEAQLVEGGRTC